MLFDSLVKTPSIVEETGMSAYEVSVTSTVAESSFTEMSLIFIP